MNWLIVSRNVGDHMILFAYFTVLFIFLYICNRLVLWFDLNQFATLNLVLIIVFLIFPPNWVWYHVFQAIFKKTTPYFKENDDSDGLVII